MALSAISFVAFPPDLNGARLLGERAAILGYCRAGSISPGGACRFLETADGWIALNLAREDDWRMLPALVEREVEPEWPALARAVRTMEADALVAQGRDLGLAIAPHAFHADTGPWHRMEHQRARGPTPARRAPLVVELASLWAGPLCGHLLRLAGARVIKVESLQRPDGTRSGSPAFHDLLNGGKDSMTVDFATEAGRDALRRLIARADIIIDASRPRALAQLGLCADDMTAAHPGLVWLSITGYGRREPEAGWIAFGDDAGVAAGLSALFDRGKHAPIFCGDAIADPLTGLHAALAALSYWRQGRGGVVSLALRAVVGGCIAFDRLDSPQAAADRGAEWQAFLTARFIAPMSPTARRLGIAARPFGADTGAVMREFDIPC